MQTHLKPSFCSDTKDFTLYNDDCVEVMNALPAGCVDLIFADPPYFLSNNGITCQAGKMVSVNKGKWDKSKGHAENFNFTKKWISACKRLLKPNGTIWISGTSHIIHIVGVCLAELEFKTLNDITWVKTNPPPNLACRYFTHATETIIWAARDQKSKHYFNYDLMKKINGGKQMMSVWRMDAPRTAEKTFGKHPTQKPLALLERIMQASSKPGDVVLDPFSGSATTGLAAVKHGMQYIGIELDKTYIDLSIKRYTQQIKQMSTPLLHHHEERLPDAVYHPAA